MENITKDYVFLDGVWLKQEKLLEMARDLRYAGVPEDKIVVLKSNSPKAIMDELQKCSS